MTTFDPEDDHKRWAQQKAKLPSDKKFAYGMSLIFATLGAISALKNNQLNRLAIGLFFVATLFIVFLHVTPKVTRILNRYWHKLGLVLSLVSSLLLLSIVYFFAIIPTGLMLRLKRSVNSPFVTPPKAKTFWLDRNISTNPSTNFKKQF